MAFLPADYQAPPKSGGNYFKPEDGDNRVRIVGSAVVGFLGWNKTGDKAQPVRVTMENRASISHFATTEDPIKHFWAFPVIDKADGIVKIWEVTQATIQEALDGLVKDQDWGHPGSYDLVVNRSGQKKETKYSVIPKPKSDLERTPRQQEVIDNLDLEALFHDTDPFANVPEDTSPARVEPQGQAVPAGQGAINDHDDIPF